LKIRQLIFLGLLFVFCGNFFSQQLRFKHLVSEDGLSTNYVTAVIQDDKGFMWFGTQDGLNKYDGYQIKIFKNDPTNPNSLTSSEITCLKQVKPDLIVIGTRSGINFFNPITQSFSNFKSIKELNVKINCLTVYNDQSILAGTEEGLILVNFNTKTSKKIIFPGNETANVTCLYTAAKKSYVGTFGLGLWLFENDKIAKIDLIKPDYTNIDLKETKEITDIKEYGGKLYLGTFSTGIFKVDKLNFEVETKISFDKENKEHNAIRNISIRENKMYAATGYGLVVYNLIKSDAVYYTKGDDSYSLNSLSTNNIYIDSENNIWIGTSVGGLNIAFHQTQKFPGSHLKYEISNKNIYSFLEENEDVFWIGGVKTLKCINRSSGAVENYSNILGENTALCISSESDHTYFIGTWGKGIKKLDKLTKKTKDILSNKMGGTILCLHKDENYLYAGSVGDGLFKIDLKTFEYSNFNIKDGLPNSSINCIFVDSKKNVWLGTYDGGLVKMKGFDKAGKLPIEKIFKNEGKTGQIASNIVLGINEDKSGNIWIGTSNGLSKLLPNGSFYNFYEKDGLAASYLYSIVKDSLDNFWMSSNNGVIRFNPLQREKEIIFKNYSVKDGLINKEYNQGAAFAGNSGNMYFGGTNGFNVFRPTSIKDNLHPPQAYVASYKRGGNDVQTDSLITFKKYLNLSWRENYFQFELVALDYTDPSKNKFRYKLEGYDDEWSAPTNVRYVSYTELPGGEYTFKVKAANNDGIWNEKPYEIHITVVPPFWKTKWFYFLVFLFVTAGFYAYTQYRTNAIKKVNKILENKVAERTRELAQKNRDITSSIEYAKRIQEAILPSKEQMFKKLNKAFILYRPKDIVSGDFYWFGEKNNCKILAVVDCTGHGVPGAFMSMIGHNLLHQIVTEKGITDPAEILNNLHKGVQEALRQGQNEINTNDGMDVSLIAINDLTNEVKWAGANRSVVIINLNNELSKFDGNKFPVGGAQLLTSRLFTTHDIKPALPSMAYMFTDGYADQFGGEKGKKYMVKRFHEILTNIHLHSPEQQRQELENNFEHWRQNHEQVDDVLVVGVAI
jgi:ligand-binding sensor domain-containing protein/serine phosphatase RsbU (regulator of sigma subunit)